MTFPSNEFIKKIMTAGISVITLMLAVNGPSLANADPLSADIEMSLEASQKSSISYYELELAADASVHAYHRGTADDDTFHLLDTLVSSPVMDDSDMIILRVNSCPDPEDPRHLTSPNAKNMAISICAAFADCKSMDSFLVESFDWGLLAEIEKINPAIQTCAMYSQQPAWGRSGEILRPYEKEKSPYLAGLHIDKFKGNPVWAAHSLGIDMVAPYYKDITMQQIEEAEGLGMKVRPWKSPDMDMSAGGITPAMAALLNKY